MKLHGFANFVDQHLVPYECASMGLIVIESFMCILPRAHARRVK